MILLTAEIENKLQGLIAVLDKDIEHLQLSLTYLDELRALVIKRDEAALKELLQKIQIESEINAANERERQLLRAELAEFCGFELQQLTLSRLESAVPEDYGLRLAERKGKLRTLGERLVREHLSAGMLLADCARINSQLLSSILDCGGKGLVCYDSTGGKQRQGDTAFVNMRL